PGESFPGARRLSSLAEAMSHDEQLLERHLAKHARWDDNVFAALSTALLEDGVLLHVPAESVIAPPIELVLLTTRPGVMTQPRLLVVAGPHSRFTVVERYVGLTDQGYFVNAVSEIAVGPGASVDHYVVQEQGAAAFHM